MNKIIRIRIIKSNKKKAPVRPYRADACAFSATAKSTGKSNGSNAVIVFNFCRRCGITACSHPGFPPAETPADIGHIPDRNVSDKASGETAA